MTKIDPVRESQRLEVLYKSLGDLELAKIASEASGLTEIAHNALSAELVRRGNDPLPPQITPTEIEKEADPLRPVMIRRYRDLLEALLAKSILESAGIECSLLDENLVRVDWFYSNAVGGIKVLVRAEDAEVAAKLLEQDVPDKFVLDGNVEYQQPRCPNCSSLEVSLDGLDKSASYASLAIGIPIQFNKTGWIARPAAIRGKKLKRLQSQGIDLNRQRMHCLLALSASVRRPYNSCLQEVSRLRRAECLL